MEEQKPEGIEENKGPQEDMPADKAPESDPVTGPGPEADAKEDPAPDPTPDPEQEEEKAEEQPEEEKQEEEKPQEQEKEEKSAEERKWYVIQTFSGQEDKVKHAIESDVERLNLKSRVFQVLIPEEEVIELKGTKRVEKTRKMFPGYVFLEMVLDDETWYSIRQTPGVSRFIGTKVTPTPVLDREMQRVLKQIGVKAEKLEVAFSVGETIRVISGPFRGYTGTVNEINADKGKLKVLINIFGRDTPVEVNFEHAEKII